MDILLKNWLPILCAFLLAVIPVIVFAVLRRKGELKGGKRIVAAVMTVISILGGVILSAVVLAVGGGMDLILPLLMIPLLIALI